MSFLCSLSVVNVLPINKLQDCLEAVAAWSSTAAATVVLASDEWTKEHGTGLSFHVGISLWRAVELISDAVEAWIVAVPTSADPEQSDCEDFLTGATAIREDIVIS